MPSDSRASSCGTHRECASAGGVLASKGGSIWHVPSAAAPGLQEALTAAKPGDCIFLAPGAYMLCEPIMVSKPVHIIGINEVGAHATITFQPQHLRPPLPLMTVDAADCRIKGVHFVYEHPAGAASAEEIVKTNAVIVKNGASVTFDECKFSTSVSCIKVMESGYATLLCVNIAASGVSVSALGKVHIDRSDVGRGTCGLLVEPTGIATVENSVVCDSDIGVQTVKHGRLKIDGSLISDCRVGIHVGDPNPAPQPPMLIGNEIVGCETGIQIVGGRSHVEVRKNFIHKCTHNAILVLGGSSEIRANAIKDCPKFGIHIGAGKPTVEGNIIQSCTQAAILCRCARPVIAANEIVGNKLEESSVGLLIYHPPPPTAPPSGAANRAGGGAMSPAAGVSPPMANLAEETSFATCGTPSQGGSPSTAPLLPRLGIGSPSGRYASKQFPKEATPETEDSRYNLEEFMEPTEDPVADPTVEGNIFGENSCNVRVVRAGGSIQKNEFLPSSGCSVCAVGAQLIPVVISENHFFGSQTSYGVYVAGGAQAKVYNNAITNMKLSAISLKGCGPTDVHSNTIDACLDAIVAQDKAYGCIGDNFTSLTIDIFTDSIATMLR